MDFTEFTRLRAAQEQPPTLSAAEVSGPDRTLVYGYTSDRSTWHVYLRAGEVHLTVYNGVSGTVKRYEARTVWNVAELVPDKRVYPESVDGEFASLLLDRGQRLPYKNFDENRHRNVAGLDFHGVTYDAATGVLDHHGSKRS
ncbi:hypothetical protein [Streptomyces sp. RKAG337]|uniref:hypothetical protein n=1 Tax=Streptomyces sp. RKAG337 TaxID=2893404 RepID=UPI0020337DB7|nr:hypothetical protein [Streptomyces sp. RKAG337]MCM2430946.1 hypothetical protein [Streptomyces sp. RKAG337]